MPIRSPISANTNPAHPPVQWDAGDVQLRFIEAKQGEFAWKNPAETLWLVAVLKGGVQLNGGFELLSNECNLFKINAAENSGAITAGPFQGLFLHFPAEKLRGLTPANGTLHEPVPAGESAFFAAPNVLLDLPQHNAIQAILTCPFAGEIRQLFLQAKCLELLALFFQAETRRRQTRFVHCRTEYDRERLLFAREYLLQHYDLPPTLAELARIAGINEFKLKNGFKELFGKPVFAYLNDYKMEIALRELSHQVKTASQLAFELGYSSLQHFSRAFKGHFGYSPGRVERF